MSHQDSESDGSTSPSSSSSSDRISPTSPTPSHSDGSVSPSNSISSEDSWDLHHLGHVEAIPIKHGGILKVVLRACVEHVAGSWVVLNLNHHGPDDDICFRIPGSGNNWIACITDHRAMDELRDIIRSDDTKGYKYHWYSKIKQVGDTVYQNFIIESYLEGDKKERVPEGLDMIPTLEERLDFMVL
ncbi:unnamed protein product [Fusarium equiseti]|uniref:Uncharacterized protein n=1 Tax=Fusarium equiseti TaxID=61235 RepID=A0A8J2IK49_FUSEQ|nr:unnamed protein product [Fusarium equiseti]